MTKKFPFLAAAALILLGLVSRSSALQKEDWELQRLCEDMASHRKPPDANEFVFARVQYTANGPGRGHRGYYFTQIPCGGRLEGWAHDYPAAEENLLQIAREATGIYLSKQSYVMVRLDSDDLFKYPWGLMSEVGEATFTDKEVANIREYLNRGGFLIADDFDGPSLDWFEDQMRKAFPDRRFVPLTLDNPVFHTFYDIKSLDVDPPYPQRGTPKYYGMYDDHGRLCMVLNHNNDIGDFWEWVDETRYPLAPSIFGLQLGINYFMYALTH